MSNAIKSSATSAIAPQGTAAAQPVDWLSRQGSEGQGGNAGSFARWMAQHNPQTQAPIPQASPTAQAARATTANAASHPATPQGATKTGPGWSTTQQKLATARSQSAMSGASAQAAGQGTAARQAAAQKPAQAQAQAKADAAKSSTTAKANRPADAQDGTATQATQDGHEADAAKADKEDTHLTTAQPDGATVARELTPPPTVQPTDPAGMMAWLASLSQAGGEAGTHAEGSELAGAEGDSRGLKLGEGDEGRGVGQGHGRGQGLALGLRMQELGQDAASGKAGLGLGHGDAALQVDALLGKGSDTQAILGSEKGLGQDVAALLAGDGARAASFGQALADVGKALPHAQASLPTPLDAPDFSQKLADQVSLWVGQSRNDGPMTAELHLNPAEMGPINVKISLDGQSAHVDFAAAAQETRQAIEASLSVLSSSLNDVGLSLSGGGVFSQTPQQQAAEQGFGSASGRPGQVRGKAGRDDGDSEPLSVRQVSAPRTGRLGGLDLYA